MIAGPLFDRRELRRLEERLVIPEQQFEFLIDRGCSLIRLGDGEGRIIRGESIRFQAAEPMLASELHGLVSTYSRSSPFVIGLPLPFIFSSTRKRISAKRLRMWSASLDGLISALPEGPILALDSFLFRSTKGAPRTHPQVSYEQLTEKLMNYRVGVVANSRTISRFINDSSQEVRPYVVPQTNAFSEVEAIQSQILDDFDATDKAVILVSAGPAGKVLAGRISSKGFRVIDVGHILGEQEV